MCFIHPNKKVPPLKSIFGLRSRCGLPSTSSVGQMPKKRNQKLHLKRDMNLSIVRYPSGPSSYRPALSNNPQMKCWLCWTPASIDTRECQLQLHILRPQVLPRPVTGTSSPWREIGTVFAHLSSFVKDSGWPTHCGCLPFFVISKTLTNDLPVEQLPFAKLQDFATRLQMFDVAVRILDSSQKLAHWTSDSFQKAVGS